MKQSTLLLCIGLALLAVRPLRGEVPVNQLTEAERRGGWQRLFDGKSAEGWRNYGQDALSDGWQVRDGALVRAARGAGDIITRRKFSSFELSLEYNIARGGNSGLMFHVVEQPGRPPWHSGPEVQILDNERGRDPQKAGWLYQLYRPVKPDWARRFEAQVGYESPEISDATRPAGQWNRLYLRVSDAKCEVAVNGVSYFYFVKGDETWNERVAASKFARFENFGKASEGHLCLQDHGNRVAFRNIKIRELKDGGAVPDPVDGELALKPVVAFPELQWEGWEGIDENGKVQPLRPIQLTHAGDGSRRIFVASQRGRIHVFPKDDARGEARLFLDIRERVQDWRTDDEEGLLGLAFHPEYRRNGQFFVYYTSSREPRTSYVSRFRVSSDDPDRADPDSEERVLRIPQPFANHNGGSIVFGNDGYLYIGLGDGGGRNDPESHGQNLATWMGCLLRIDVDGRDQGRNYAVPRDNPFRGRPDARPEIYAYGFRNIWRLSVDRETGAIFAPDVGQDLWEEINVIRSGGNYGWSSREGTQAFGADPVSSSDPLVDPIWEYDHQVGKSITGGEVYRGSRLPALKGKYIYADYITGKIWALDWDPQEGRPRRNFRLLAGGAPVIAFGADEDGEVYYMLQTPTGKGILRFEPQS